MTTLLHIKIASSVNNLNFQEFLTVAHAINVYIKWTIIVFGHKHV